MAFDIHKNFACSNVATAPSPATSGTSLVVAAGDGAKFPAVPFNVVIWPANVQPSPTNAEIVRVTAISTDTFTITRTQEGSSARTVIVGDQISQAITVKVFTDIEGFLTANADGMQVQGGATPRTLKWSGANVTIVGAGTATLTFPAATDNIMGETNNVASQADMEAASSITKFVSPGRQTFHPATSKCWANIVGAGTSISASYNITSITDTGTGDVAITIATDFSSANWCCVVGGERTAVTATATFARDISIKNGTMAAGTISLQCWDKTATTNVLKDPNFYHMVGFGDQ